MRRLPCVALALLPCLAPVPAASQTGGTAACLDVQPESGTGSAGSPVFIVVALRELAPGSTSCDGPPVESGERTVVDVELSGANDFESAETGDSPDSPDTRCAIDPAHSIQARCAIAIRGEDVGTQTIRAWIDADDAVASNGATEADRTEGPDEDADPGTGCVGPDATAGEPDCTDVARIEWSNHPRCFDPSGPAGRIAYRSSSESGPGGLYTIDPGRLRPRLIEEEDELRLWVWSPGHRRIAYIARYGDRAELRSARADGSGDVRLTSNGRSDEGAAWSPDSSRIAYASHQYLAGGNFQLYVVDADGRGTRRLTRWSSSSTHPDWSPDGRWIVFARYGGSPERSGIFRVDPDGGKPRRLVSSATASFQHPVYSPDGRRILVRRNESLFVMSAGGGPLSRLTPARRGVVDFEWSPDGRKVVYETWSPTGWSEIRVAHVDGSRDRRIVRHFGAERLSPSWSPDSRFVSYALGYDVEEESFETHASNLWVAAANGSCSDALTFSTFVLDQSPTWTNVSASANPFEL